MKVRPLDLGPQLLAALLVAAAASGCGRQAGQEVAPAASAPESRSEAAPAPTPVAAAGNAKMGDLAVSDAWARATAPGAPVGAAYFKVTNNGTAEDTLMALSSTAVGAAELHETTMENGVARMRPVGPQVLSGGQSLVAEPGGLHVMLTDLKAPLVAGQTLPLTLAFKFAGPLTVQLAVRPLEGVPAPGHTEH